MGQYAFFLAFREGLLEGAKRAGVPWASITVVSPYPVISHQGEIVAGGKADAVTFDSYTDAGGNVVDTSDMNGNTQGWGWPGKAATILTAEHVRLLARDGLQDGWELGVDFGTFNNDNVPTPGLDDHEHAYRRAKGHFAYYRKLLALHALDDAPVRLPEYYAKAQWQMQVEGEHFVPEGLRDAYQASIRACFLIACYEEGIAYPDMWSPFGRGDQSTDAAQQGDPNQWHGGVVKRTVTDNADHAGSAVAGGGTAQAALVLVAGLRTHFAPGVALYGCSWSGPGVVAMATDGHALLVNLTGEALTVRVGAHVTELAGYEVMVVAR
jgi:hypothetical protein